MNKVRRFHKECFVLIQIILVTNNNDPLSTVTQQLEDIHVTVHNENSVPVDELHEVKG